MLKITMTERHYDKPFHQMSEDELYDAMTSAWVMNPVRARKERYAVGIGGRGAAGATLGVMALEIEDIVLDSTAEPGTHKDDRYRIIGKVLGPGHPVYDAFVGEPAQATRNPVRYEPSELDLTACRCGCGEPARLSFLPGHDQRALHERVNKLGSVAKFCDWFDKAYPTTA
jgi:hypothetical protein